MGVYNKIANMIPTKPVRSSEEELKPPWWTGRSERALKNKQCAWKRYNDRGRPRSLYLEYVKARKKADTVVKNAKFEFERRLALNSKKNVKAFYKYANSKLKTTSPITSMKVDGHMTSDENKICGTLSSFFSSVFTEETDLESTFVKDFFRMASGTNIDDNRPRITSIEVTDEDVLRSLRRINPYKSVGPDDVHRRLLKEFAEQMHRPLAHIFRTSFETGTVPDAWKTANVIPIHKKGSRTLPENQRPVSLTSHPGKLQEKLARNQLMQHLESHVLVDAQHGFRRQRSCTTNLLTCMETWTRWLDEGHSYDVVYLDFRKAFDTVPHQRLLTKLWEQGIDGDLLTWLTSFLTGRTQRVKINTTVSEPVEVTSGIPQGSVLGPVLFIAYINDILENLTYATGSIFADDTKIFAKVDTLEDGNALQRDLQNGPGAWATENIMGYNESKCKVVHYGRNNPKCNYELNGVPIEATKEQGDLGVLFDDSLSFSKHITTKTKKAKSVLGVIHKTFDYKAIPIMENLYTGLVRPHLEYAVQVWSPYLRKDIIELEKVQKRATKRIPELKGLSYERRLDRLGLTTLEERRARGDAIETFKILGGHENVSYEHWFQLADSGYNLRRHSKTLFKQRSRLETRKNFFSNRVVNAWNSLNEESVSAGSVNSFKNEHDKLIGQRKMSCSSYINF